MKINKENLLKIASFLLGGGLLILMIVSYQKKQAVIINEKEAEIARELAINQKNETEKEKSGKQIFYDLSLMGVENFQPTSVVVSKTNQWGMLAENSQQIVIINGENKKFIKIPLPMTAVPVSALAWNENNLIAYAGALYEYKEKANTWEKISADLGEGKANLLAKFDLNYYLVGANSLQKLVFNTSGWQKAEKWLDEKEILGNLPIDLWIDGSIYVSDQVLGVKQFIRGQATTWNLEKSLLPPLYLAKNGEEFVVLAPKMGAVFRLNQKGEKIAAFEDEDLIDCRFVWLKENSFFTIKNNFVYNFSLP